MEKILKNMTAIFNYREGLSHVNIGVESISEGREWSYPDEI